MRYKFSALRTFPKVVAVISILLATVYLNAQNIDSCGLDDNPEITRHESEFLNDYLADSKPDNFDFNDKRIVFVTGNSGNRVGSKSEYFDRINAYYDNNGRISTWIVPLNEIQKQELQSKGYDAIVTYWVKLISERRKRKIIQKLK